jgi:hypothetical protein
MATTQRTVRFRITIFRNSIRVPRGLGLKVALALPTWSLLTCEHIAVRRCQILTLRQLTESPASAERHVLTILGPDYSSSDVTDYISSNYTTHDFLPEFVRRSDIFQAGMPDCIFA